MVGRAVVARPWEWASVDSVLYGAASDPAPHRRHVLDQYCAFAERQEKEEAHKIRRLLIAPALNLFAGEPNGKTFRRVVDEIANAERTLSAADVLRRAAEQTLLPETLDAPPGARWDHRSKQYFEPPPAAVWDSLESNAVASQVVSASSRVA